MLPLASAGHPHRDGAAVCEAHTAPTGRSSAISPAVVRGTARAADVTLAALAGLLVAILYVDETPDAAGLSYLAAVGLSSAGAVLLMDALGVYKVQDYHQVLRQWPRVAASWCMAVGLLESALFFLKAGPDLSRGWLALWFVAGLAVLSLNHMVRASLMRSWARAGRLNRRAVIFGAGPATEDVIREIAAGGETDVRIAGVFDDRNCERTPSNVAGYPCLGGLTELMKTCRETRVDMIIVALPITGEARLARIVKELSVLPADIKLPASAVALRLSPRAYSQIGSASFIDVSDKPLTGWSVIAKALFDKSVAAAALVLLAPVMAAVALAIRFDSRGPVLFRQKRYGFNNELIEVLKFRSMYVETCDARAARLVTRDDPRVTRVGRFIRKTSLDELPQLFNVLGGTLSLVGPRPHALAAKAADRLYGEVVEGYDARHRVKPGITGWAQINGWRGETDTAEKIEKRVELDLYYIENWSLLFDLYILAATPLSLLKTRNAY